MPSSKKETGQKKKPSPTKKEVIKGYERLYGARLTEEELDELIEDSFSNPDVSPGTRKKVEKKLKEKKAKKKEPKEKE